MGYVTVTDVEVVAQTATATPMYQFFLDDFAMKRFEGSGTGGGAADFGLFSVLLTRVCLGSQGGAEQGQPQTCGDNAISDRHDCP